MHRKAEYKNLAVCLLKLDKKKLVQSVSSMLSNRWLEPNPYLT